MDRRNPPLLLFGAAALTLLLAPLCAAARDSRKASDEWLSVRSQNFLVVGQAGEDEMRRAAQRLEEYRAAFSRLLSGEHFDFSVPTTVILFRDDAAYTPYKPLLGGRLAAGVAGHFQPGAEVNYITIALDSEGGRDSSTLLHEYAHLLVNNYFRLAPLWVKEGLAEYYSTARLSKDRRRLTLGGPIRARARALRAGAWLPLRTLFAVDQQSPHYFEAGKRGEFYAESWALVHYLMSAGRREQFSRLLGLLAEGATIDDALREALHTDAAALEAELLAYVAANRYAERTEAIDGARAAAEQMPVRALSRAESLYYLGDLLLRSDRRDAAEEHLRRALEADPSLAAANVSIGVLLKARGSYAEARAHLERATASDPSSHLAHYHLADTLYREGVGEGLKEPSISAFEEKTSRVRAGLVRASEIAPGFVEARKLLAAVELDRGAGPDEAAAVLVRALAVAPRRADLKLLLAQALTAKGDFAGARRLTAEVEAHGGDPLLREQARRVFAHIAEREEREAAAREREREEAARAEQAEAAEPGPLQPCDMPLRGPQRKALRFDGAQACGRLLRIECDEGDSVSLLFEGGERILRLRAAALNRIRFVTYTAQVKTGQLTCGPRQPADYVLVTYRPRRDDKSATDGEAVAVEFIPEGWNN
ncbi:MAG TPA: tetratricopeptide repeat protein [Pyrinomonadaceae bacterium]|nr:tetratricopeptide repeat protein [Pyrinomonadaceae bacterium]